MYQENWNQNYGAGEELCSQGRRRSSDSRGRPHVRSLTKGGPRPKPTHLGAGPTGGKKKRSLKGVLETVTKKNYPSMEKGKDLFKACDVGHRQYLRKKGGLGVPVKRASSGRFPGREEKKKTTEGGGKDSSHGHRKSLYPQVPKMEPPHQKGRARKKECGKTEPDVELSLEHAPVGFLSGQMKTGEWQERRSHLLME